MKKFVSLRVQRIMMYIPFVNCLILFVWLFNYRHSGKDYKTFGKSLIIILCVCAPLVVLQILFSKLLAKFPNVIAIVDLLAIYIIPFVLGFALIKYQEKVLNF